jgi:hypothetical protein
MNNNASRHYLPILSPARDPRFQYLTFACTDVLRFPRTTEASKKLPLKHGELYEI